MQKPVLVACQMLEDEIHCIFEKHQLDIPVIWIDRGLHDFPSALHDKLTEVIADLEGSDYDAILFGFMLCGNAMDGIQAGSIPIVFPKYHDCIDMQLSEERDPYTMYMTAGWLRGPNAMQNMYRNAVERYGEKKAKKYLSLSLKNYQSLTAIDTGAYSAEEAMPCFTEISEFTGLPIKKCKGNYEALEKLLTGNWDGHHCILNPHEKFSAVQAILES